MDKAGSPSEKKFISTPVTLTSTRMGLMVLPFPASESLKNASLDDKLISMTTTSKEQTYYDRKLILSQGGKSYSGIIQMRPSLTDRERREPERCYALLHFTEENKATLNFCTQLQMLVEDM